MIPGLLDFNKELRGIKQPKGEDFINKKTLQSNDIFCLVFTLLTLCNGNFSKCFTYLGNHKDCLIKFDRIKFKNFFNDFMFSISSDKNLIFVIKKLINIEKYDSGKNLI